MTSVSAASSAWQHYSPSQLLQNQLQQDANAGQISSTDQTALTSALDQIQTSLQSGAAASPSPTSSTQASPTQPPTPDQLQSKVSSLIDAQVSAGTLTSSQATELKDVFQQTFGANGPGGSDSQTAGSTTATADTSGVKGHHGSHHHAGSSADAASATDSDGDGDSSTSGTASANTSSSGGTQTAQQLIDQFLQNLQSAQSTAYGAAGTSASSLSSLLLNVTA